MLPTTMRIANPQTPQNQLHGIINGTIRYHQLLNDNTAPIKNFDKNVGYLCI